MSSLVVGVLMPLLFWRPMCITGTGDGESTTLLRNVAVMIRTVREKHGKHFTLKKLFIVNNYFTALKWSERFLFNMLLTGKTLLRLLLGNEIKFSIHKLLIFLFIYSYEFLMSSFL